MKTGTTEATPWNYPQLFCPLSAVGQALTTLYRVKMKTKNRFRQSPGLKAPPAPPAALPPCSPAASPDAIARLATLGYSPCLLVQAPPLQENTKRSQKEPLSAKESHKAPKWAKRSQAEPERAAKDPKGAKKGHWPQPPPPPHARTPNAFGARFTFHVSRPSTLNHPPPLPLHTPPPSGKSAVPADRDSDSSIF